MVGRCVGINGAAKVESWHRSARPGKKGAGGVGVRLDGAVSATEPFALGVDFVARGFQGAGGVQKGGLEVRCGGHFGELTLYAYVISSAVGLDDRDAFGDASSVCGIFFVFGSDVFAREGVFLSDGGRFVGVSIADGVKEAVMLVPVVLASSLVEQLLIRAALGGCSVTAVATVLGEEFFGLVRVVVQGV